MVDFGSLVLLLNFQLKKTTALMNWNSKRDVIYFFPAVTKLGSADNSAVIV
jgi:hypothetical protein